MDNVMECIMLARALEYRDEWAEAAKWYAVAASKTVNAKRRRRCLKAHIRCKLKAKVYAEALDMWWKGR